MVAAKNSSSRISRAAVALAAALRTKTHRKGVIEMRRRRRDPRAIAEEDAAMNDPIKITFHTLVGRRFRSVAANRTAFALLR